MGVGFGFGILFLVLGHSLMLHNYFKNANDSLGLKNLMLPPASSWSLLSVLCIFLAILFLSSIFLFEFKMISRNEIGVLLLFGIYPLFSYLLFLKKRISKVNDNLVYVNSTISNHEIRLLFLVGLSIGFIIYFINI